MHWIFYKKGEDYPVFGIEHDANVRWDSTAVEVAAHCRAKYGPGALLPGDHFKRFREEYPLSGECQIFDDWAFGRQCGSGPYKMAMVRRSAEEAGELLRVE